MGDYFAVEMDSRCPSSGLALLGDKSVKVGLLLYTLHYIDVTMIWSPQEHMRRFTGYLLLVTVVVKQNCVTCYCKQKFRVQIN